MIAKIYISSDLLHTFLNNKRYLNTGNHACGFSENIPGTSSRNSYATKVILKKYGRYNEGGKQTDDPQFHEHFLAWHMAINTNGAYWSLKRWQRSEVVKLCSMGPLAPHKAAVWQLQTAASYKDPSFVAFKYEHSFRTRHLNQVTRWVNNLLTFWTDHLNNKCVLINITFVQMAQRVADTCILNTKPAFLISSPATRHGGAWRERRYSSYSFTTSALDGSEWSASRPGRAFTPGERTPGTHCTGGWVGLRAGLDTEDRGKILCPCRGSNPDRPVVQPVVRHYTAKFNLYNV
jgi:hypothetical protein